ncbi:MAG: sulfotransferase [Bacteroidota bacterium]
MTNKPVIYIVGVGRSGTSMLMTLLNGHSAIAFTPETHFLRYYLGTTEQQKALEDKGPVHFQHILEKDTYFQRLKIPAEEVLRPYLQGQKAFRLDELYRQLLATYLHRKNKQIIGDKDPRYLDYLQVIANIYPTAHIIHIHRDPRDVVLSKPKADWSSHRPFWVNAIISQVQMKEGREKARAIFGDRYYELAYEDLVVNPQGALSKLLAHLGLEFEEDMLDLTASAKELVDESELQWKGNTFKPMLKSNTEKWRTQFPAWKIRTIEIICKEWFEQLGYQHADTKVNFLTNGFLKLAFSFRGLQSKLYHWQLARQLKK